MLRCTLIVKPKTHLNITAYLNIIVYLRMRNFLIIFKVLFFGGTCTTRRIYTLRETLQGEDRQYASPQAQTR